jgi:hypothetical protein
MLTPVICPSCHHTGAIDSARLPRILTCVCCGYSEQLKRGATMVTKEEARAAVETEIALNLARPMTPAEEDEFCQIANGRLNYQSNTDQTREIRAWVKRRPEVRTLISNAVAIFARHSAKCPHRAENNE